MRLSTLLILTLSIPALLAADTLNYSVEFSGISDSSLVKTLRLSSELVSLRKRPPDSLSALHFRAESDIPNIKKVLYSFGYYEAQVALSYDEKYPDVVVKVSIEPGPLYTIGKVDLRIYSQNREQPVPCSAIEPKTVGLIVGSPAQAERITRSESMIAEYLANCGYPLSRITKRQMIADGEKKQLFLEIEIDAGPICHFGALAVEGLVSVSPRLIQKKMTWKRGDLFKNRLLEKTQEELINTALFSSVLFTHAPEPDSEGQLPLKLEVTESKHKSINLGASYQTYFGPGITFGWEDRNIKGMGRKLSIQADATKRTHSGTATFLLPDFYLPKQNYIWQAQALHESIIAYSQRSYNIGTRLETQLGRRFSSSLGLKLEKLYVTGSVHNGRFLLFEIPIYNRWSSANNLLNPTRGASLDYAIVPSMNIDQVQKSYYLQQVLTLSSYLPLLRENRLVLAQKITAGSILSQSLSAIPVSRRFLGGSEEDLRGYQYKTVSPLNHDHKPIGGRSALYYTVEARVRLSKTFGIVPFFDTGNVQSNQLPTYKGKWLKSIGIGARYFSFIGPFRLDVGIPLDRRKDLDPKYRIFVSIGQSF